MAQFKKLFCGVRSCLSVSSVVHLDVKVWLLQILVVVELVWKKVLDVEAVFGILQFQLLVGQFGNQAKGHHLHVDLLRVNFWMTSFCNLYSFRQLNLCFFPRWADTLLPWQSWLSIYNKFEWVRYFDIFWKRWNLIYQAPFAYNNAISLKWFWIDPTDITHTVLPIMCSVI